MVKAVHIITRLDFGGAQGNTLYTVAHLDPGRFTAELWAGAGGLLDAKAAPGRLRHVARLGREINPFDDFLALVTLRGMLRGAAPDIVHTHSSKAGILGRLAAAAAGVPVVVHTFHGFGFNPLQSPLKRGFFIFLEKLCALSCSALIFVSKDNMETARSAGIGSPEKYRLIRSGVRLSDYPARVSRREKRAQLNIPAGALVVAAIGNAKPQKNPGDFLKAAARLLPSRPEARFVFVGGGEELEALRAKAAGLGLADRCLFTGWREDSAEILAASDIFALTSMWEGLPRSLVEALRTGLPAVCYSADGVSDILRPDVNGYPVKKGDLDGFCSTLGRVMDDAALRARLAAGAAATDLSEFDIDNMVKQQEELYAELLAARNL